MKRKIKKKFIKNVGIFFYIISVIFISLGAVGIFTTTKNSFKTTKSININLTKTVSTKDLMTSFQKIDKNELTPLLYNEFEDAVYNSKYYPTSFVGKLTHYGPDCPLCGGTLGCNGQDARNGNIYYNDSQYGKIRVVATSSLLPCGSIIKINLDAYDNMHAIVMDRGVSGNVIDLLKESSTAASPVRTVDNVTFDIVRYGY